MLLNVRGAGGQAESVSGGLLGDLDAERIGERAEGVEDELVEALEESEQRKQVGDSGHGTHDGPPCGSGERGAECVLAPVLAQRCLAKQPIRSEERRVGTEYRHG